MEEKRALSQVIVMKRNVVDYLWLHGGETHSVSGCKYRKGHSDEYIPPIASSSK
jgi:hypothetical protein